MAVRHEQKAVEEGTSASEAAALEQERRMLYCLGQVPSLGAVSIQELGEFFGGFSNLFNIEETALRESGILREGQIQALCDAKKNLTKHLEDYERLAERGIWFVTPLDKEYPERLRHIHGISDGALCAREASGSAPSGQQLSLGPAAVQNMESSLRKTFAELLAKEQVQIHSGLALRN